jgi:hypothetical protein
MAIREGIKSTIKKSPDGDILREILELRIGIELGLFTLFVKIKSKTQRRVLE